MKTSSILISTADERLGRDLAGSLSNGSSISLTTQLEQVRFLLDENYPELMLLDLRLSPHDGLALDLIDRLMANSPKSNVIAVVSPSAPDTFLASVEQEQLTRYQGPVSAVELRALISRTLEQQSDAQDSALRPAVVHTGGPSTQKSESAKGEVSTQYSHAVIRNVTPQVGPSTSVFEGLTRQFETRSTELKQMLDDLMIAAGHDVTILLIGETGSGKTFLSNLVHEASPRKHEPFLHIACGALPRDLIESELFGHVKGSFTSAHADKEGKFLAARRGTILLDEIDVLGPEQQVKLLKVIETGDFEPVGSNQTLRSQARLVVASNLDLQPLVEAGKFRPDLYYRLNMLKFEIPPLRRRKVDIIPLARKFVANFQKKHNIAIHHIDDSLLEALLAYPWPGNVRELEHVIQRTVIYCRDGVLSRELLPSHMLSGHIGPTNDASVRIANISPFATAHSLEHQVSLSEKEIIEQTLLKNNFSRTRTSQELGISRVTLYNKMKKYEMLK